MIVHERATAARCGGGLAVEQRRARMSEDDDAFTWLFRGEFTSVVRVAFLIVHDRQRAEDIAQDAFTQLYVHWQKVSHYERPDAWVRRVAVRAAVRSVQRERMRARLEHRAQPQLESDPVHPDVDLMRAIEGLPPKQRAAVTLFYLEDRPTSEVADILNCSESTAKGHLFKARRHLAAIWGNESADAP